MRNMNRSLGVVLAGLPWIGACLATAGDWPQWRGRNRDFGSAEARSPGWLSQAIFSRIEHRKDQ